MIFEEARPKGGRSPRAHSPQGLACQPHRNWGIRWSCRSYPARSPLSHRVLALSSAAGHCEGWISVSLSIDQEDRSRAADKVLPVEDQGSSLLGVADAFLRMAALGGGTFRVRSGEQRRPLTHQPPETAERGPRRQVPWDSTSSLHFLPAVQHAAPASPGSELEMQTLRPRPDQSCPTRPPGDSCAELRVTARPRGAPGPVTPAPGFFPVDALNVRNVRRAGRDREVSVCWAPRVFFWRELILSSQGRSERRLHGRAECMEE